MTGYKKFFDQKELQIKISSSLLNVSNDSSKPEDFSLKDIEVFQTVRSKIDLTGSRGEIFRDRGYSDIIE